MWRFRSIRVAAVVLMVFNAAVFLFISLHFVPGNLGAQTYKAALLESGNNRHSEFQRQQKDNPGSTSRINMAPRIDSPQAFGAQEVSISLRQFTNHSEGASEHRLSDKPICGYRTTSYIFNTPITLNEPPFLQWAKSMVCTSDQNAAFFGNRFAVFRNMILDPSRGHSSMKGGEKMEDVWNQRESNEYFKLSSGYFNIECTSKPPMQFLPKDHLQQWANMAECYKNNKNTTSVAVEKEFTLAIQRYEYVNLYHTMCDFYNAFVLMLIFGIRPSKMNILFVDTHPAGDLDLVWSTLFGKFTRAGHLDEPVLFHNLAWGITGYFSPLNMHPEPSVPYLEEFRDFFLRQHGVSVTHKRTCSSLKVLFIWRRDYVAHPRNQKGLVQRKFDNEEKILEQTRKALGPGHNVTGVQLDRLDMRRQLELISQCDILAGMHGAGLSHVLFLPPTSGVLELKPSYSPTSLKHFEKMSAWRNLPYVTWHNNDQKNEKGSFRTRIPEDVVRSQIENIYSRICNNTNE